MINHTGKTGDQDRYGRDSFEHFFEAFSLLAPPKKAVTLCSGDDDKMARHAKTRKWAPSTVPTSANAEVETLFWGLSLGLP